jgi:nucleotide-binding universal stress UspA family protein
MDEQSLIEPQATVAAKPLQLLPFRSIVLGADASDHSNRGAIEAASLAALWDATITGAHVYAAQLHDRRFRQMEGGLPESYRQEAELERQRDIHDDLITRGLSTITDSYLDQVASFCVKKQIGYRRVSLEGKNYRELTREFNSGCYDLAVLGSLGLGAVPGHRLGTVCERVLRRTQIDTLVIKDPQRPLASGPLVAAVDGSAHGFGGLLTALDLARRWQVPLHVIAAFDPYYHYVAFNRIAAVLSEEAGRIFRFKDQEKLHEEIIDAGLAKIYQGHLDVAASLAAEAGVPVATALLDGKPFEVIGKFVSKVNASLLLIGKLGIHADDELDIGGNAEHLVRESACAVWLSQRQHQPETELLAEITTSWTHEAEALMDKVPSFARAMARGSILRHVQEHGHTVVTAKIVSAVTNSMCPAGHQVTADPQQPGTPAANLEPAMAWDSEAESAVLAVTDRVVRDHVRHRAEKRARVAGVTAVQLQHVQAFLEQAPAPLTAGCPFARINGLEAGQSTAAALPWDEAAKARLARIPEGFMRSMTCERVDHYAREHGAPVVTVEVMEGKFAAWAEGSKQHQCSMSWDSEAASRLARIPDTVRGMVIVEVERCARKLGLEHVHAAAFTAAIDAWSVKQSFHSISTADLYE